MPLLSLAKISKSFGPVQVLRDVTFEVERGEKIGLVGDNGSGKTTVFRIALGEIEADGGGVATERGVQVAYMAQAVPPAETALPLRAYVLEARAELARIEEEMRRIEEAIHREPADPALLRRLGELGHAFEALGGYRAGPECDGILAGLGFGPEHRDVPVGRMSGGERTKAALARLLLQAPDVLLLDEPTNHLDIWAATWLEDYLVRSSRAAVVVSHDRYFLDRVATKIVELSGGVATSYKGDYTAYVAARDRRRLTIEREYEKQQAFIRKEEDFIRRYHAAQRAREARGRKKRLERIERIDKPEREREFSLKFGPAKDRAVKLVRLAGVRKSFGDRELFRDVDLEMQRGERIGLIGPNGVGKTTLLRIVVGLEPPSGGNVERGKVCPAFYDQHQDSLDERSTVLEELERARPDLTHGELRGVAGRFLFSGDDVFTHVNALSGGERARLALAKLIASGPSLLVLDEPTNHLDIRSREAVEKALGEFDGSVLMVTHDRRLLDAVVETILVLKGGRVRMFAGGYSEYRAREEEEEARGEGPRKAPSPPSPAQARRLERKRRQREERRRARRLAAIEGEIERLEARHADLMARFEDPALYADASRTAELAAESRDVKARLDAAYRRWEDLERKDPDEDA